MECDPFSTERVGTDGLVDVDPRDEYGKKEQCPERGGDEEGELCSGAVSANDKGSVEFGRFDCPLSTSVFASMESRLVVSTCGLGGGGGVSRNGSGMPVGFAVYARDAEFDLTRGDGRGSTE